MKILREGQKVGSLNTARVIKRGDFLELQILHGPENKQSWTTTLKAKDTERTREHFFAQLRKKPNPKDDSYHAIKTKLNGVEILITKDIAGNLIAHFNGKTIKAKGPVSLKKKLEREILKKPNPKKGKRKLTKKEAAFVSKKIKIIEKENKRRRKKRKKKQVVAMAYSYARKKFPYSKKLRKKSNPIIGGFSMNKLIGLGLLGAVGYYFYQQYQNTQAANAQTAAQIAATGTTVAPSATSTTSSAASAQPTLTTSVAGIPVGLGRMGSFGRPYC